MHLFSLILIVVFNHASGESSCDNSIKPGPRLRGNREVYEYRAVDVEGKAKDRKRLAGIFPIHKENCVDILSTKNYNGFQRAEAMTFALDQVNELVRQGKKEIALDGYLLDTCSNGISAIDATIRMMRDAAPIVGLVGASYSSVTTDLSKVLQTYNVTMLSYASTATGLANKQLHPLFARLVPSDVGQARVVYELAKHLGWKTVEMLILADNDYSKSLRKEFQVIVNKESGLVLCDKIHELKDIIPANKEFNRDILKDVMTSQAEGVIVFVVADAKKYIVDIIAEMLNDPAFAAEKYESLKFIATDSWDVTDLANEEVERYLKDGSYVVIPDSPGFNSLHHGRNITEHFEKLTPKTSKNPWTKKVWRSIFDSTSDVEIEDKHLDWRKFGLDSKVDFVVDSVLVFSDALERCAKHKGCDINSEDFFINYILKTNLTDDNCHIEFDRCGNRLGMYGIYQLSMSEEGPSKYLKIGHWSEATKDNRLKLDVRPSGGSGIDGRICRPSCTKSQFQKFGDGARCCYKCEPLPARSRRKLMGSFFEEADCGNGNWPNETRDSCYPLTAETLSAKDAWAVVAIAMAVLGLLVGLVFLAFTLYHYNHNVIKNCSRELSAFTWIGVMISHVNTLLVFYTQPGTNECALIRFTMTIGYTCILSSLFLKVNRLWRIFYAQFKQSSGGLIGNVRFASPKHQVMLCSGLVLLQVLIVVIWIAAYPPTNVSIYPEKRLVEVCELVPLHLLLAQSFNIVLCIVTTAYSFLTRDVPENFNESRFINLSMYSICVSWIVESLRWVFGANQDADDVNQHPERTWAISTLANSGVATLVLLFLFAHRVFKIMWEKPKGEAADEPQIIRMSSYSGGGVGE